MRKTLGTVLFGLSGWLLMVAMVLGVWLRGSVSPLAIETNLWILATVCIFWGTSLFCLRRVPVIPKVSILGAILLVQGWIMAFNPISHYDAIGHLFPPLESQTLLPGSVDGYSSTLGMYSFTVLFVVFHVAIDCWRNESFRQRVLWTAAITAACVSLLGILQKANLAGFLPAGLTPQTQSEFGPFDYHANAAALLLGCLPIATSLAVGAWVLNKRNIGIIGGILALLILVGIFANTARAGIALVIPLLIILAVCYWVIIGGVLPGTWRGRLLTAAAILLVGVAGLLISAWVMPAKWAAAKSQMNLNNPRLVQWKIILGMSEDAGLFGSGPNTFSITFPVSKHYDPKLNEIYMLTFHTPGEQLSIWSHAHSDPLQALIEYGWVGGALWVAMALWTLVAGWKQMYIPAPLQVKFTLLAAYAGLFAIMAYCTFDFPLQVLSIQIYAMIFAGIVWAERMTELQRIENDKAFGYQVMLGR